MCVGAAASPPLPGLFQRGTHEDLLFVVKLRLMKSQKPLVKSCGGLAPFCHSKAPHPPQPPHLLGSCFWTTLEGSTLGAVVERSVGVVRPPSEPVWGSGHSPGSEARLLGSEPSPTAWSNLLDLIASLCLGFLVAKVRFTSPPFVVWMREGRKLILPEAFRPAPAPRKCSHVAPGVSHS